FRKQFQHLRLLARCRYRSAQPLAVLPGMGQSGANPFSQDFMFELGEHRQHSGHGPEEKVMGWYYYLENKLRFPFQAKCITSMVVSPLRKGETVEARRMAPEEACAGDMLVLIRWQSRNLAAPLSQLVATDADEPTIEAIGDWHYWVAQGYGF